MKTLFSWDSVLKNSEDAYKQMLICEAQDEEASDKISKEQQKYEDELNDDFKLKKLAAKFDDYDVCFILAALIKKIKSDPAFEDNDNNNEMFMALNEMYKVLRKALNECKEQYFAVKFGKALPQETPEEQSEAPAETEVDEEEPALEETENADEGTEEEKK